jgi:formylglycine-generating enzyme required for sulfatase activity
VAHEAIFRRWDTLKNWIVAEREFLSWRSGLEAARGAWQAAPECSKRDALLMGFALAQARSWLTERSDDISETDHAFIVQSRKAAQWRTLRMQVLVGVFVATIVAGIAAWWQQDWLNESNYALWNVHPLKAAQERALKVGEPFKECTDCPEMIVVPAGHFTMGSPSDEKGRSNSEGPQHRVTIAKPFAVSKFELTFSEWDTCAAHGDCDPHVNDEGWGRGQQPAIFVSWDDAQRYVAWLSRITAKKYRLLSEAEYEYAARAGTQTAYPWGDDIKLNGVPMANCIRCGWSAHEVYDALIARKPITAVGSFAPNKFGLYDVVGNVWEWTEDCSYPGYKGAPADGSPRTGVHCIGHVARGGSWSEHPDALRSARRNTTATNGRRGNGIGFRVARTLLTP